jgi:hypothetical protein
MVGITNQAGWDALIPIYRSSRQPTFEDRFDPSKLSYIAVQVKNRSTNVTATRYFGPDWTLDASQKMNVDECLEVFIDLRWPISPPIYERLPPQALGPKNRHHLTISGFGGEVFPIMERLDPEVFRLFPLLLGFASSHLENDPTTGINKAFAGMLGKDRQNWNHFHIVQSHISGHYPDWLSEGEPRRPQPQRWSMKRLASALTPEESLP